MNSYTMIHYVGIITAPLTLVEELLEFVCNLKDGMPFAQASDRFWAVFANTPVPTPFELAVFVLAALFWGITSPLWVLVSIYFALFGGS